MGKSAALEHLNTGLIAVDNVLSFAKKERGKPTDKERSLFVASVTLSYAVWENFAEDLVIEAVDFLADAIDPAEVPPKARSVIERNRTSWELSVHPGWRALWKIRLQREAKGSPEHSNEHGINTANEGQLRSLFDQAGLDPFDELPAGRLSELNALVKLRGAIAHTGRAPDDFFKANAVNSRDLVAELAGHADAVVRGQVHGLVGKYPW